MNLIAFGTHTQIKFFFSVVRKIPVNSQQHAFIIILIWSLLRRPIMKDANIIQFESNYLPTCGNSCRCRIFWQFRKTSLGTFILKCIAKLN